MRDDGENCVAQGDAEDWLTTYADKLLILKSGAFAQSLGVEFLSWKAGSASLKMPAADCITDRRQKDRIDQRAFIGFLDELSAYAVTSVIPPETGMSTVDLKIDFVRPIGPGDHTGRSECLQITGEGAFVRATALNRDMEAIAVSNGWFHVGAYPGQPSQFQQKPRSPAAETNFLAESFEHLLGADREDATRIMPAMPRLLGGNDNPAFHGGAVGALLASVCLDAVEEARPDLRLASVSLRYLRASRRLLRAASLVERIGSRAAFVNARASEDGADAIAATASCVFLRSTAP